MRDSPFPIAVLISGSGRTLRNLIDRASDRRLGAEIRLVVSSHPRAGGLEFAREAGIAAHVVERSKFSSDAQFGERIFGLCRQAGVDLIVMAGFIKYVPIPDDLRGRVLNIHPALVPAFCGKGYYGMRVHEAVLAYGAKVSGCTVHFVDNQYDHGPVLLQRTVPVLEEDTAESLAARVFQAECEAYPQAIQWVAEGRVRIDGRRVRIAPPPGRQRL